MVSQPFDLAEEPATGVPYPAWRERRLASYPATSDELRVQLASLANPSRDELAAIGARVAAYNMAWIQAPPSQVTPEAILAFGRCLGLSTADSNLFADHRAVSTIAADGSDNRADYIPYTNRPLSWHTDGYYNPPDAQVRAWVLFCLRPAVSGGANALLDPEIAYIALRDRSPGLVQALLHPRAFSIPANRQGGRVLRPASVGPVFSFPGRRLHMRYSGRSRAVIWRDTPDTRAARDALDRLFLSPSSYTFTVRLGAGEGLVSNNVLHNRTGFEDQAGPGTGRLLYRVRYLERIALDA